MYVRTDRWTGGCVCMMMLMTMAYARMDDDDAVCTHDVACMYNDDDADDNRWRMMLIMMMFPQLPHLPQLPNYVVWLECSALPLLA